MAKDPLSLRCYEYQGGGIQCLLGAVSLEQLLKGRGHFHLERYPGTILQIIGNLRRLVTEIGTNFGQLADRWIIARGPNNATLVIRRHCTEKRVSKLITYICEMAHQSLCMTLSCNATETS